MTAYLIVYGATPADSFAAYSFPTREAARLAAQPGHGNLTPGDRKNGGCAYVIETEADVTFSGQLLVDVFNALTDSGVKRFESRNTGIKRLMSVLPTMTKPGLQEENQVEPEQTPAAVLADKPKRGRKAADGRAMTMAEQMDAYNQLVDRAVAVGVTKFKRHTSTFMHYEDGEKRMKQIEEAIAAVQATA